MCAYMVLSRFPAVHVRTFITVRFKFQVADVEGRSAMIRFAPWCGRREAAPLVSQRLRGWRASVCCRPSLHGHWEHAHG